MNGPMTVGKSCRDLVLCVNTYQRAPTMEESQNKQVDGWYVH